MEPHVLQRLRYLELVIVYNTRRVKDGKDELKRANEALAGAYEALRDYARDLADPEKTPLLALVDPETGEIRSDEAAEGPR